MKNLFGCVSATYLFLFFSTISYVSGNVPIDIIRTIEQETHARVLRFKEDLVCLSEMVRDPQSGFPVLVESERTALPQVIKEVIDDFEILRMAGSQYSDASEILHEILALYEGLPHRVLTMHRHDVVELQRRAAYASYRLQKRISENGENAVITKALVIHDFFLRAVNPNAFPAQSWLGRTWNKSIWHKIALIGVPLLTIGLLVYAYSCYKKKQEEMKTQNDKQKSGKPGSTSSSDSVTPKKEQAKQTQAQKPSASQPEKPPVEKREAASSSGGGTFEQKSQPQAKPTEKQAPAQPTGAPKEPVQVSEKPQQSLSKAETKAEDPSQKSVARNESEPVPPDSAAAPPKRVTSSEGGATVSAEPKTDLIDHLFETRDGVRMMKEQYSPWFSITDPQKYQHALKHAFYLLGPNDPHYNPQRALEKFEDHRRKIGKKYKCIVNGKTVSGLAVLKQLSDFIMYHKK